MDEQIIKNEQIKIAETIKKECIKTALEAYESASQNGVCCEGAWECAVDAVRSLDIAAILNLKQ